VAVPRLIERAAMTERWRDLVGPVGLLPTGPRNAITDVPGVRVGHARAQSGELTGVTVVEPPQVPARAGVATTNGVGELTKKLEIDEWGVIQTAVYLCGTHALGMVYHAAVLAEGGDPSNTLIPVVGECDDSDLGDSRTITVEDVVRARAALGEDVAEGSVGGGTGMTCFDFAGGIGTASRRIGDHTLGVLLMCNFGERERLTAGGLRFDPAEGPPPPEGSCIAVCACDAPMSAQQLRRLALRPLLGLARAGSYAHNGSGEIALAFTTNGDQTLANDELNPYFAAAYEAAEEAVYNCLVAPRPPMRKRDGREHPVFPVDLLPRP
jgi:D-aminopeptidase